MGIISHCSVYDTTVIPIGGALKSLRAQRGLSLRLLREEVGSPYHRLEPVLYEKKLRDYPRQQKRAEERRKIV